MFSILHIHVIKGSSFISLVKFVSMLFSQKNEEWLILHWWRTIQLLWHHIISTVYPPQC